MRNDKRLSRWLAWWLFCYAESDEAGRKTAQSEAKGQESKKEMNEKDKVMFERLLYWALKLDSKPLEEGAYVLKLAILRDEMLQKMIDMKDQLDQEAEKWKQ